MNEQDAHLYDMTGREWVQGKFLVGDEWRSKQVYECTVCSTRTNAWVLGGFPNRGPRKKACPGTAYREHDKIEDAMKMRNKLDRRIAEYDGELRMQENIRQETRFHIDELLRVLRAERELVAGKIERLRALFAAAGLHDVLGQGIDEEPVVYTPGSKIVVIDSSKKSLAEARKS